ncbi:AAA family ATPase [Sulfurimonas paralvinellae]|uniref:MoxR family ATPase n=1 Tax=Sulfurimonas paralvinellae TaxID=317658 RepID=A0A7M1B7J4_9BACT|nr:MoxR family ATPase [Sulfurimonas paralvinellae]QOP45674.1 MoxR family ATPase [Sulfurimonas paralvinellae]
MSHNLNKLIKNIQSVIVGKEEPIKLLIVSLLAKGHILIEDTPGLGKTILARALSKSISTRLKRVQCTPDLLPSDITGVSIYNEQERSFEFKAGPIFTNILLVDEINRTTPRTQSSMLEAMEEEQVTVDGKTYKLPSPFMVIATQNPIEFHGTYPLPEAQLDRFFMKIGMGYPTVEDEIEIMQMQEKEHPIENLKPVISSQELLELQKQVLNIKIDKIVLKYIALIMQALRKHNSLAYGASPRGSLALMHASKAFALVEKKDFVDPDIIKRIAVPVLSHRIVIKPQYSASLTNEDIIADVLAKIEVPK